MCGHGLVYRQIPCHDLHPAIHDWRDAQRTRDLGAVVVPGTAVLLLHYVRSFRRVFHVRVAGHHERYDTEGTKQ